MTRKTSPVVPLFLPVMTTTLSPFLIFSFSCSWSLQHLRRERDNFHEALAAQFAGHRAEDTRADRLILLVDQDDGIAVETDFFAVIDG